MRRARSPADLGAPSPGAAGVPRRRQPPQRRGPLGNAFRACGVDRGLDAEHQWPQAAPGNHPSPIGLSRCGLFRIRGAPGGRARVPRLGPYEVDFLWREHRLVVEADSWRHHSDRAAFEADRIRDTRLQAAGYRVLRLTHRRLRAEPAAVAASLRAVMHAGHVPSGPKRQR
ncbi:MAG: endonuclease domain-containing protein [Solirubrobacterales bacterium]